MPINCSEPNCHINLNIIIINRWLVKEELTSYDRVHVLGSSMGAQAAGYVGHFTGEFVMIYRVS